jgi:hypothetical protein
LIAVICVGVAYVALDEVDGLLVHKAVIVFGRTQKRFHPPPKRRVALADPVEESGPFGGIRETVRTMEYFLFVL